MQQAERRLTTIMFTDIFGYSKLMSNNEQLALDLIKEHDRISQVVVDEWNGKIIKRMGDAIFAEFPSTINGFEAAHKLHDELKIFNSDKQADERIIIRIGLHIGDVLVRDKDLFGDGVNVAARLEKLSVPGGICISQAAYTAMKNQVSTPLKKFENVELKNIADRYTVYQSESIYPTEFPIKELTQSNSEAGYFNINSIKRIPSEKFTLTDSIMLASALMLVTDFGLVYNIKYTEGLTLNASILQVMTPFFIVINLVLISFMTTIILRSAIKVNFQDIRGVDSMLNLIIQKAGFAAPTKKGDDLVFKPSLYNFIFWSSQKMIVNINGNNVIISGSFWFIRKVKKLLKAYES